MSKNAKKRIYWRLYLQYMNHVLRHSGRDFDHYITFGTTEEEAIAKVVNHPWEIWAETEVLHVEKLDKSSWPPADKDIFTKKERKRKSQDAIARTVKAQTRKKRTSKSTS